MCIKPGVPGWLLGHRLRDGDFGAEGDWREPLGTALAREQGKQVSGRRGFKLGNVTVKVSPDSMRTSRHGVSFPVVWS